MAKGAEAKQHIADKMAEVFGVDWIGEYEKKYYVWSIENGERVQVAISMTCPKVPIEAPGIVKSPVVEDNSNWDWGDTSTEYTTQPSAEITQQEQDNLRALLEKLGL